MFDNTLTLNSNIVSLKVFKWGFFILGLVIMPTGGTIFREPLSRSRSLMLGRLRLLAVSPNLEGDRQLSHTMGKFEARSGFVIPRAALATSTVVAGRLVLVP